MRDLSHLDRLPRLLRDPLLCLRPGLVESKEAGLTTALDQLVWLCDELRAVDPLRELCIRGDGVGGLIPGNLGNLGLRVDEWRCNICLWLAAAEGGRAGKPVGKDELCVVFSDGYMRTVSE